MPPAMMRRSHGSIRATLCADRVSDPVGYPMTAALTGARAEGRAKTQEVALFHEPEMELLVSLTFLARCHEKLLIQSAASMCWQKMAPVELSVARSGLTCPETA